MKPLAVRGVLCFAAVCSLTSFAAGEGVDGSKIKFKRTRIDDAFRSEGSAVGDLNKDGKLDIVAGFVYYAAPDWKMHKLIDDAKTYDPHNYSNSFVNATDDLNGDGWTDVIVADFPGQQTWWFENPQSAGGPWKRHVLTPVTNNESPQYLDVDGDGRRELVCAVCPDAKDVDGPLRRMALVRRPVDIAAPWQIQSISAQAAAGTQKYSHGLGVGDINRDGRNDVMTIDGWWESPADESATDKAQAEWKFHPAKLGQPSAHMFAYDFDGDGDNDVLNSAAHKIGIWWHEQKPDGWQTHEIDASYSETHSMCFADMNGDGQPDFVTGKRWWSHGPTGEPMADQPAVLFWYELKHKKDGQPEWIRHAIDHDSGVGTQFEVSDVNGDGLLDVVTSNKKGTHYFQQTRE